MSLVLLAVIGMLLAGVARHSVQLNVQTAAAVEELQVRWGAISLRRTLSLRSAVIQPQRIAQCLAEKQLYASPFPWEGQIELSGRTYEFTIDTEERKLNLNRLSAMRGNARILETVGTLTSLSSAIVLRPTQITDAHFFGDGMFDSWGQVFDFTRLPENQPFSMALQPATKQLTLWGSGRLAVHDVPLDVLKFACGNRVSDATLTAFDEVRQELTRNGAEILESIQATNSERSELERWLTDELTTYLVTIQVADTVPARRQFSIVQQGRVTRHQFAW